MNQLTLNLIAIGIFSVVLMILVGPLVNLSPTVPALVGISVLGLAAVDTFGFQGQGGDLLIDALAQRDPEYRRRILHHEAGHFLVAHLLDVTVTDYTLSAWEACKKGQQGRGGVQFDLTAMIRQAEQGMLPGQSVDSYCTVWMAGIAAEQLIYGESEGGGSDREQIRLLWSRLDRSPVNCDTKMRWSVLNAKTLIERHRPAYDALVALMAERSPVEECIQSILVNKPNASPV